MENIEKRLGSVVRALRLAAGMTQENLAQQLTAEGLPTRQNTVAKLENGLRPTSVVELAALAAIFNLTVPELSGAVFPVARDESALAAARAELEETQARISKLRQSLEYIQDSLSEMRSELMEREMRAALLSARIGPEGIYAEHPELFGGPLRGLELDKEVDSILRSVGKSGNGEHSEEA